MRVICSGCGVHLGDKPADNLEAGRVSHGLCRECAHHFMAQVGLSLADYLQGLSAPVVTVSPEGTIGTANDQACAFLGKTRREMRGEKGGVVFLTVEETEGA